MNSEEPKLQKVNINDLIPGPIQHQSLPEVTLQILKTLYEMVGHYSCSCLEEWEKGFMRDMDYNREIRVWSRIALGWRKYHEKYQPTMLPEEQESELVGILTALSLGVEEDALASKIGQETFNRLKECYVDPS